MSTIVIGAGIIGLHIAESLTARGENVTVIDGSHPGGGTTATSFAWVNANTNTDPDYHKLKVAGMAEHREFARRGMGRQSYFETGGIQFTDEANAGWVLENVARLRAAGYSAEWMTADEARNRAEISRVPEDTTHVACFGGEGYLLPDEHILTLVDALRRRGARFVEEMVEHIEHGDGSVAVTTAGGAVHRAERIVLAAGRWTKKIAAAAGFDLPMITAVETGSPLVGVLGNVRTQAARPERVVHSPRLNLRPSNHGRVVVQALDLNAGVDPLDLEGSGDEIRGEFQRRFHEVTGEMPREEDIDVLLGLRSLPLDGFPVVGFMDTERSVYAAVTHGGITLGPLLGRLSADELLDRSRDPLLESFGPERFTESYREDLHAFTAPTQIGQQ